MLNWDDPTAAFTSPANTPAVDEKQTAENVQHAEQSLKISAAEKIQKKNDSTSPNILSSTEQAMQPVRADDKRVINGKTDINQLAPFKYPWAWDFWLNANRNHWTPLDINMSKDVHDYQHRLTLEEKHVYENVLSYLTTSDILAMRNIGLAVMEKMTAPELQIYQT